MLGQSGDAVFEKHYQSQFIGRDLQHVVLLRPPQEGLVRLLEVCSGKGIFALRPSLPIRTSVLFANTQIFCSLDERRESQGGDAIPSRHN